MSHAGGDIARRGGRLIPRTRGSFPPVGPGSFATPGRRGAGRHLPVSRGRNVTSYITRRLAHSLLVVLGVTLLSFVILNLIADIIYARLDPRVRMR